MNKKELIDIVAETLEVTKKEATLAVHTVFGTISSELDKGGKVSIVGFGTFEVVKRNERKCRNLQTQEEMMVPAKMAPKFRPSKNLKDSIALIPVTE